VVAVDRNCREQDGGQDRPSGNSRRRLGSNSSVTYEERGEVGTIRIARAMGTLARSPRRPRIGRWSPVTHTRSPRPHPYGWAGGFPARRV